MTPIEAAAHTLTLDNTDPAAAASFSRSYEDSATETEFTEYLNILFGEG